MTKIAQPSPAIFTSDPLEQIFARQMQQPNAAGLWNLMLHSFGKQRQGDQDEYMGALSESNRMARALAEYEARQETAREGIRQGAGLAKEGFLPSTLTGGSGLFNDIPGGDTVARQIQELRASQIFKNRNDPGGGGGGKEYTEESVTRYVRGADGQIYPVTTKSRSANPAVARGNINSSIDALPSIPLKGNLDPMTRALIDQHNKDKYKHIQD